MNQIVRTYVTVHSFIHSRVERFKDPNDRGASAVEYAALIILAAALIGALYASGVVSTASTKVSSAVNAIFNGGASGGQAPNPKAT
jgi:Flp pilus assembly pilin Flp